jgi:peptidoglycan/LPS O-acetylase OafA/YrhL
MLISQCGTADARNLKTEAPAWIENGRIPCLDGMRAFSIVLVLSSHVVTAGGSIFPAALRRRTYMGGLGVDIFFVISGFLITLLLLREHKRNGEISLKSFYTRRVLRILPAYFT